MGRQLGGKKLRHYLLEGIDETPQYSRSDPQKMAMAGGGILRDTPSPPSTREPSPVKVIDATNLNEVRFYTYVDAFTFGMWLPFSMFVNDLLEHINRAPGQVHPIGWLKITIFQVACKIARIRAAVPLLASLFNTSKPRPFDTTLGTKGGGRMSKNFLADSLPNKVHSNRFNGHWFFVWGGMGPRVPIRWTALKEVGSLYMRDFAFIKSQVQALREAIPVKLSWKAYCQESALIMKAVDPTKVEVVAMKGKRLPRFSSQLVFRKPLVPGSEPVPVFVTKRGYNSQASTSISKSDKSETLTNINTPSLTPTTSPIEVISLDDELTISAQGTFDPKKKKILPTVTSVCPPTAIILLLVKSRTSSKKGKGKNTSAQGEGSSLDSYSARYIKVPYSLPNGWCIEEGHLWNNCMEAFMRFTPPFG
ncbi:hypothetical protein LIER_05870 [Lithospermum erythrorhizon]|uniref:Transposase (putative) gypsy type domain-containing protein n=1 Tax=Lithospermum erythrorhizon TaxID=34254 RepID=A0AAV3P4R1_LITER